ncbi:2TM domain-containing protein [Maribacter sp. 2210JD10-5]|uniref:2TM domain-containing protein n=1 Tax=Maribacter sp. 2210JD10-5 TaxID=3386272 RepID=UPI0039BD3D52
MGTINNYEKAKLDEARLKVAKIKGFYSHLTVYLVINTTLTITKLMGNSYYGETFMGPFWHFSTFATWFFWGIGLFFHGLKVFSANSAFMMKWEERQIQKFMENDRNEVEKFK